MCMQPSSGYLVGEATGVCVEGGVPEPNTCWTSPWCGGRDTLPDTGANPCSVARDMIFPIGQ